MPIKSVVLESNPLVSSGWPQPNARLQLLLQLCLELEVRVFLPEAVALELQGRFLRDFKEPLRQAHTALRGLQRQLQRVDVTEDLPALTRVETAMRGYSDRTEALAKQYRIETIPIADVRLADLVSAAAARESPFDEKGEGFRDAVILISIEATPPPVPAILVTADGDFTSEDVQQRLDRIGVSVERTIEDVIDMLQQRLSMRRQAELAQDREQAGRALDQAKGAIQVELAKLEIRAKDLSPESGVTVAGISAIELGEYRRVDVSPAEGGAVVITATAPLVITYFGFKVELADQPLPLADDKKTLESLLIRGLLIPAWGATTPGSPVTAKAARAVQIDATAERSNGGLSNARISRVRLLSHIEDILDLIKG